MIVPMLLSGLLCFHSAWSAEPSQLRYSWGLPLHAQPMYLKLLLAIPLGLAQGVIVILAWDQYLERVRVDDQQDEGKVTYIRPSRHALAFQWAGQVEPIQLQSGGLTLRRPASTKT